MLAMRAAGPPADISDASSFADLRLFALAHVIFVVLTVLLFTDQCEGLPGMLPNHQFSIGGIEYISEKLMDCKHSSSWWTTLPQSIGVMISVLMIQNYITFSTLSHNTDKNVYDVMHIALSILNVAAWGALLEFDHRKTTPYAIDVKRIHMIFVVVFLTSFFLVHAATSRRYYYSPVRETHHAQLRRYSYYTADAVYVIGCVLFCVFALLSNVYHAIIIEYVVAFLFWCLATTSFIILVRIRLAQAALPATRSFQAVPLIKAPLERVVPEYSAVRR